MIGDTSFVTKSIRWVLLAAILLAMPLMFVAAARSGSGASPDGSTAIQNAANPADPAPGQVMTDPPDESAAVAILSPSAVTMRPGSLRTSHPVAAGLVGLGLATLALAGLTAAVLARRDELARH